MSDFSQQIKKSNGGDEWYTLPETVQAIVPFLNRGGYKKILCPFDKADSYFVKVLTENGFEVEHSHIDDGIDFFEIENLNEYDAVVSNPPFSKRQAIFEKLFNAKVPFALVINFNGLFDAKSRWELFKANNFEILVPKGRWHFFNSSGEHNSPNFQSVYVCNGMSEKQIDFIED